MTDETNIVPVYQKTDGKPEKRPFTFAWQIVQSITSRANGNELAQQN